MSRRVPRLIAVLSAGLILCTFVPGNAARGTDEEFVTGSGTSYAQIVRIGPTAGQLSLAPVFGLSLSDYVNTVGRGQATVADWAGIGVAERSLPDNTPIVKMRSTDKDADKGTTQNLGAAELYARATKAPSGEGRFRITSFDVPGLIEARGSESNAISGVKGRVRESVAITKIGVLDIAGGAVSLKGLRWESIQRTGAKKTVSGTFTVDGVSIGGVPVPMPGGPSDLKAVIDPINTALAQIGLSVSLPVVDKRGGQSDVSPLSVDIKNSPAGRQFLAPILAQLQEPKQPVIDAFADLAEQLKAQNDSIPDLKVGILLADLTIGIVSGSSQLHLEFGGVSAFTEGEKFESPFGGIDFNPPKNTVAPPKTIFTPGTAGTPGSPGTTPIDEGTFAVSPAQQTKTIPGDKGGLAVAVGLIGLGVAIGLAIGDWYRMRISRRAAAAA
jgi:hypothetical protein